MYQHMQAIGYVYKSEFNAEKQYLKFSLSTYKKIVKDGKKHYYTTFFNCVHFSKSAEKIFPYLKDKTLIQAIGEIKFNKVEDKTYTSFVVHEISILRFSDTEKNKIANNTEDESPEQTPDDFNSDELPF